MMPSSGGGSHPPVWFRVGARVRGVATLAGLLGLVIGLAAFFAVPEGTIPVGLIGGLCLIGAVALMLGLVLTLVPAGPSIAAREIAWPVRGRWRATNGPADNVPSHGTHGHGQTFAIDLVHEPDDDARPAFGAGPAFRPPDDFPGFGHELLAPADGDVVAVHDGARDHRSRSTWPAVGYMLLEGMVREAIGTKQVIGNFVVVDIGNSVYALLAHLQRGSATVGVGQSVQRGEPLGRCGNSGNSSEPHLHFQLMDHPRPFIAAGLPFAFSVGPEGTGTNGVPCNEEIVVAAEPSDAAASS